MLFANNVQVPSVQHKYVTCSPFFRDIFIFLFLPFFSPMYKADIFQNTFNNDRLQLRKMEKEKVGESVDVVTVV